MEKYILTTKYLQKIIDKRKELNNPEKSGLLKINRIIKIADYLENLLRRFEDNQIENFDKIFNITLNNRNSPDDRINDMFAELWGAEHLIKQSYSVIKYNPKKYDFDCEKGKNKYAVEVECLRGPSYKRQKRVEIKLRSGLPAPYIVNSEPEIKRIKGKIAGGISQLNKWAKNSKKIVIIVTNDEAHVNFDSIAGDIKKFRKNIGKKYKCRIDVVPYHPLLNIANEYEQHTVDSV